MSKQDSSIEARIYRVTYRMKNYLETTADSPRVKLDNIQYSLEILRIMIEQQLLNDQHNVDRLREEATREVVSD